MMARDYLALVYEIELRSKLGHRWETGRCCVSFSLACVFAQTGIDYLADLPRWSNRAEALEVARSLGGLRTALNARFDRTTPALAQRGDIAGLPDADFGVRLMVVEGETLVGPALYGNERLDRGAMRIAWRAAP
ncbi:MAG: hypothetical protein AAFQ13_00720 [Pseudomonadota bacterium]